MSIIETTENKYIDNKLTIENIFNQTYFNSHKLEVINTHIDKFNKDFKNIENSFQTVNKQNKIFHDEIKTNKNLLDILSKERVKNQQFNDRVNDQIVNIQISLEELNKNKSPKKQNASIDKINNKLNTHSQKLKELDKLPSRGSSNGPIVSTIYILGEISSLYSMSIETTSLGMSSLMKFFKLIFSIVLIIPVFQPFLGS